MTHDTHLPLDELARRSGRPRGALIEEALPGLPANVHNLLRRNNVNTLGDLLDRGETGMAEIHYFGWRSLAMVKAALIRTAPFMVTVDEAVQVLRGLLDQRELFSLLHRDGDKLDVRHHRAVDLEPGPTTHVTVTATTDGPAYAIVPAPLPGRDAGEPRVTRYAHEAAAWIHEQTLYPYPCLEECGNPAGTPCEPGCASAPDDRYNPPRSAIEPEDGHGGGLFADEPPFPDPWAAANPDGSA